MATLFTPEELMNIMGYYMVENWPIYAQTTDTVVTENGDDFLLKHVFPVYGVLPKWIKGLAYQTIVRADIKSFTKLTPPSDWDKKQDGMPVHLYFATTSTGEIVHPPSQTNSAGFIVYGIEREDNKIDVFHFDSVAEYTISLEFEEFGRKVYNIHHINNNTYFTAHDYLNTEKEIMYINPVKFGSIYDRDRLWERVQGLPRWAGTNEAPGRRRKQTDLQKIASKKADLQKTTKKQPDLQKTTTKKPTLRKPACYLDNPLVFDPMFYLAKYKDLRRAFLRLGSRATSAVARCCRWDSVSLVHFIFCTSCLLIFLFPMLK